jgi:hypothetical protein
MKKKVEKKEEKKKKPDMKDLMRDKKVMGIREKEGKVKK